MSSRIVEGVVLEHPDECVLEFYFFETEDLAAGYLKGAEDFGSRYGELLSIVDTHTFVADWYEDEDGGTFKSDAIKQIEEAKARLNHD